MFLLFFFIRVQEKDEKIRSVEENLKSTLKIESSRVKAIEVCLLFIDFTHDHVCHLKTSLNASIC